KRLDRANFNALLKILWRQGIVRSSRWKFWPRLVQMYRQNPRGIASYVSTLAQYEHFHIYRRMVRSEIEGQIEQHLKSPPAPLRASSEKTPVTPDGRGGLNLPILATHEPAAMAHG